ncbi:helix-turn-helix transcriptional regulator [Isoptericola sp. NPDC056573]|uniref:helix-turn-helix transcriptional regulator n=1 Tax=Isoptericola sp. NPDC056573 TaxID=3345868 RepID=UPI0036A37DE4
MDTTRMLTINEVADYLQVPVTTLYRWRCEQGKGPKGIRVGRYIRYRTEDVQKWLRSLEPPDGAIPSRRRHQ